MHTLGQLGPRGDVALQILRARRPEPIETLWHRIRTEGLPLRGLDPEIRRYRTRNLGALARGLRSVLLARALRLPHFHGALSLTVLRPGRAPLVLGLVGLRVVTTAGVNFLVDALQGLVEPEVLKYHGIGTGSTAEAVGDTALVTELTTEYNPDSTRATGSLTEGGGANVYRTVGTNTLDGTPGAALREHGIFSQAATGGGTLLDRTVYGAITLNSGDGLQSTYDLSVSSGG